MKSFRKPFKKYLKNNTIRVKGSSE